MPTVLDHLLARFPDAKRTTLRRMLAEGRVRVNGQVAKSLKQELEDGVAIEVSDRPAGASPARAPGARPGKPGRSRRALGGGARVIYEDADLLVVHKPAGLLTSTTPREKRPTLLKLVRAYLEAEPLEKATQRVRLGLIHRLDREASGLLVFSKNTAAYESLKDQFYRHTVERVYLAVVEGKPHPPKDRIETQLMELPDGRVVRTRLKGKGQRAVTDYEVLETRGERTLIQVTLQTGRKHQIRAHLSSRGWPIVGDAMYGASSAGEPLHLCAVRLGLVHPRTGAPMTWEIKPPFSW